MASINVTCPACTKMLRVPDKYIGVRIKCKSCQQPFVIDLQDQSVPAPPDLRTMDVSTDGNVFEQQTIAGIAPPVAAPPAAVPPAGPWDQATQAIAPAAWPAAPAPAPAPSREFSDLAGAAPAGWPTGTFPAGGPPPLPPRPPEGPKLKVGALVVSLVSLAVICGSIAGVIVLQRPDDGKAAAGVNKYAVIAVESGGVRLVVAPIETTADGYTLGDLVLDDRRAALAPQKGEKELNRDRVSRAMDAVGAFAKAARSAGVAEKNLFVVCNVNKVLREFETDKAALDRGRATLEDGVKAAGGGTLTYIAAADEARFNAVGCLPVEDRKDAVVLDLGGRAGVCGYYEAGGGFVGFDIPELGTSGFAAAVKAAAPKSAAFATAAAGLRPTRLVPALQREKHNHPALENRTKVHLLGGTAWAAAVHTHPAEMDDKRVPLTATDVQNFLRLVSTSPTAAAAKAKVLGQVPPGPARERADRAFADLGDQFTLDGLVASANVLQAVADECQFRGKDVRFFTKGPYAWPLGYLLTRSGVEK